MRNIKTVNMSIARTMSPSPAISLVTEADRLGPLMTVVLCTLVAITWSNKASLFKCVSFWPNQEHRRQTRRFTILYTIMRRIIAA